MTKRCFKCGATKPLADFYRHPRMADGRLNKCRDCAKRDVSLNYRAKRQQYAAYERERFKRPERKAAVREGVRRRREQDPVKAKARNAVWNALRDGRLTRPAACELCGEATKIQAHHEDYAKPLEVEWLCFRCHREERHGQTTTSRCSG